MKLPSKSSLDSDGAMAILAFGDAREGYYLLSANENWSFDARHLAVTLRHLSHQHGEGERDWQHPL
jgi:hypothetical protein